MSESVLYTVMILSALGAVAAVILYFVSKKFYVKEDPRIAQVEDVLPATNCGGCGYPGCNAFANAVVEQQDLSSLHCPVGGNDVMKEVADVLGIEAVEKDPYVAVIRCSGSFNNRKKTNQYDGASNCQIAAQLYSGDTACAYGCVGLSDCVDVCDFDAMYMDEVTGLPVVIEDKCTACNACVTECPKDIIELMPVGKKNQRIYVACVNEDPNSIARDICSVACTGCSDCLEQCKFDAIIVENDLAYVDQEKCKQCLKCVDVCEVRSMHSDGVPEEKIDRMRELRLKREAKEKAKREAAAQATSEADDVAVAVSPHDEKVAKIAAAKARAAERKSANTKTTGQEVISNKPKGDQPSEN
ncbi:MAG TPA: ferredoxin [Flavobacteriales bacterium]|jgi:electron transport complex protein RnfB|nr:ferredoxin [Flavobacteriales bacterium]